MPRVEQGEACKNGGRCMFFFSLQDDGVSFIIWLCCISMMRGRCNKQENTGDVLRLFHAKVCGGISKMFGEIEAITNLNS